MSLVRHRLFLTAVALAGQWAVGLLGFVLTSGEVPRAFAPPAPKKPYPEAGRIVVSSPQGSKGTMSESEFTKELENKGWEATTRTEWDKREAERSVSDRSRAHSDIAWHLSAALAPLLILLGVHRWLAWVTRPSTTMGEP